MKRNLLLFAACALLLASCKSGINVSDTDLNAKVSMGLALPVGTISVTVGDLLGFIPDSILQIEVDEDEVLHCKMNETFTKPFYGFNANSLNTHTEQTITPPFPAGIIIPAGSTVCEQEFNVTLDNLDQSQPNHQRIDSLFISTMKVAIRISKEDLDQLSISDLSNIALVLSPRMECASETINIVFNDFDQDIEFEIPDVKIDLADHNQLNQVVNELDGFKLIYELHSNGDLAISSTSKFTFTCDLNMENYKAIWGYFEPSNQMRSCDTVAFAEDFDLIFRLLDMMAEPTLNLCITHKLGMPLIAKLNQLKLFNSDGEERSAQFNNKESKEQPLYYFVDPRSPLDNPYYYQNYSSADNEIHFSKREDEGCLDKMFDIKIENLTYDFSVDVNRNITELTSYRMEPNDTVYVEAKLDIPFKFKENLDFHYTDTLKDVNMSMSIDSLIENTQLIEDYRIDSLYLVLTPENYLPFEINLQLTLLDENNHPIDNLVLIKDNDGNPNRLHIPAPSISAGIVTPANPTPNFIQLGGDCLEQLKGVKSIQYEVFIGNNPRVATLNKASTLKLKIALAASVDAYLNFNTLLDNDEQKVVNSTHAKE